MLERVGSLNHPLASLIEAELAPEVPQAPADSVYFQNPPSQSSGVSNPIINVEVSPHESGPTVVSHTVHEPSVAIDIHPLFDGEVPEGVLVVDVPGDVLRRGRPELINAFVCCIGTFCCDLPKYICEFPKRNAGLIVGVMQSVGWQVSLSAASTALGFDLSGHDSSQTRKATIAAVIGTSILSGCIATFVACKSPVSYIGSDSYSYSASEPLNPWCLLVGYTVSVTIGPLIGASLVHTDISDAFCFNALGLLVISLSFCCCICALKYSGTGG